MLLASLSFDCLPILADLTAFAAAGPSPAQTTEAPNLLSILNDNEGMIQAVSVIFYIATTLVFIIATFRANKLARESIAEMRRSQKEELRPRVIFDLDVKPGGPTHVVLRNMGRSTARNVRLNLTSDVKFGNERHGFKKLMDLEFLRNTESLVPEREIRSLIAFRSDLLIRDNEEDLNILGTLSYEDPTGEKYQEEVHIDLGDFKMVSAIVNRDFDDLVRHVEDLARSVRDLARRP